MKDLTLRQLNGSMKTKGQALIIVVAILAMLFVVTTAFFVLAQAERTAALRHLDSLRAQYIAEAGIVYGQKVIALDKQNDLIDSLEDLTFKNFAGEDMDLDADGKNESKLFNLANRDGNAFGHFSLRISDEASRLNLNSVSADTLARLFSDAGIDSSKANTLVTRRPFNAKEAIGSFLGADNFARVKDFLTIYSQDFEIDLNKNRRVYLNSSQPRIILETFLAAGIREAYQKAANLKDASDANLIQTLLDKFSQTFLPSSLQEAGGWRNKGSFYEADGESDSAGKFSWSNLPLKDGEYFCFLYGTQSTDIVGGDPLIYSGEGLKDRVEIKGGGFTLSLKPAKDEISRFSHVELVSLDYREGLARKSISGTEALVINELMVKPSKEVLVDNPGHIATGQIQKWIISNIEPGNYYVVVEAVTKGGLVGDVYILGYLGNNLRDQDYFPEAIGVTGSGTITIEIRNNSLEDASFKGIKIIQEPDGEFIEIVNLSPQAISLGDFSLEAYTPEGDVVSGWPARIPEDTKIEPYQHLVLTVDNNDATPCPKNLQSNGVSFQSIHEVNAVGLIFDEGSKTIDKKSDLLPNSGGRIILKDDSGERVDAVEYQGSQIKDFTSLERGDPTTKSDNDGNGFFDGWYLCASKDSNTAGAANENTGMYTRDEETGKLIKNNISQLIVFNKSLLGLTEVNQISSGENWKKFSLEDVARMVDRFAYEAISLEMAGHEKDGGSDTKGIWEFSMFPSGDYLLSVLTDDISLEGEEIQVGVKTEIAGEFKDFQLLLFAQGAAFYGTIEIPGPSAILQLEITTDSKKIKSALKQIWLEPVISTVGRININTARAEVLRSLLASESLVEKVLNSRPLGINDNRELGIGELFLLDSEALPFYNQLTVKSDVYEITCRGDFSPQGKTIAYQTIRTVIERGD
ncbi:MAG: lamin tail domain-containing protein [Candidatus Omnitrophota bacterium]